jgi:hypothetical protein
VVADISNNSINAALFGQTECVRRLMAANPGPSAEFEARGNRQIMFAAAVIGNHIDTMEAVYGDVPDLEEPMWSRFCSFAAAGNALGALQWLRTRNVPWGEGFFCVAAVTSDVALLQWAYDHGCPLPEVYGDHTPLDVALQYERLDVLQWFMKRQPPTYALLLYAAEWGSVDALEMARSAGLEPTSAVLEAAVRAGQIGVVEYLLNNGLQMGDVGEACTTAAERGHCECIKMLFSRGAPMNVGVLVGAARRGDLPFAQWARHHGCGWDASVISAAVSSGHLELALWAKEHGCPCSTLESLRIALHRTFTVRASTWSTPVDVGYHVA